MVVAAVQERLQNSSLNLGAERWQSTSLEEHFVLKFQDILASFFEKKTLINEGRVVDALNIKPSRVWDSRIYALALKSIGRASILVNQVATPASLLLERFQRNRVFSAPLASPLYWETVPQEGSFGTQDSEKLQMKEGVEPAAAFRSFSEGLRFLGSAAVIDLAIYLLLLERFGEARFNHVIREWSRVEPIRLGDLDSSHRRTLMVRTAIETDRLFQHGQILTMIGDEPRYVVYLKQNEENIPLFAEFGSDPNGVVIEDGSQNLFADSFVLNRREIESCFTSILSISHSTIRAEGSMCDHFVRKVEELVTPFFQKQELIRQGKLKEAINIKPSGIWSSRIYGTVLKRLGETKILVNKKEISASMHHQRLRGNLSLYKPMGNRNYWNNVEKRDQVIGVDPVQLELKQGVNAAKAFTSFQEQLSFLDCQSIIDLARYLVLLERWGEERFNAVMAEWMTQSPIRIGDNGCPHQAKLIMLLKINKTKLNLERIKKHPPTFYLGQLLYMRNRSDYSRRNPHGPSSGINLVYKGKNERNEPVFIGFDLDPRGRTLHEVAEWLFHEYNQPPTETDAVLPPEYERRLQTFLFEFNGKEERFTLEELYLGAEGKLSRNQEIRREWFQYHFLPSALESVKEADRIYRTPVTKEEFLSGHEFFDEYEDYELPNVYIDSEI